MSFCAPQRYLANDRNLVREAALTPSSVEPVADSVIEIPTGRVGSAQVVLTGSFTDAEQALYEIEILDDTVSTTLVSVPIATGAGSGTLSNISATAVSQTFTIQLADAGIPTLRAGIDFEGVRIVARQDGSGGNAISLTIDQSALVFTPQSFSLLNGLKTGDGGPTTGVNGTGLDWDTKVLSSDNIIPANAHRVAFGDDTSTIYVQYKQYVDGDWIYHFVPAIKRDVPAGTRVSFVTGGRTVTVTDGLTPETYTNVETLYDLLNDLKTTSVLTDVEGVVALDRSPTGQAARELLARTDAHVEPSTGSGSAAAKGFIDTFANPSAATELVTATCFAVTADDHPLARLGAERWKLAGSVSGDLGEIVTGVPFVDPSDKFGLTIPVHLPDGFGTSKGRFSLVDVQYVPRGAGIDPFDVAALCPVALSLGPEATDGSIQLVYTKRPGGDCVCSKMPVPNLGGPCLGNLTPGGETMGYKADTVGRLRALRTWHHSTVRSLTALAASLRSYIDGTGASTVALTVPTITEDLATLVGQYEGAIAQIDALPTPTSIVPTAITVGSTTSLTIPAQTSAPLVGTGALLSGFTGADAATVNNVTVLITASTTTSISFDTPDTTGKTITVGAGTRVTLSPERTNGMTEWDAAATELEDDFAGILGTTRADVLVTAAETLAQGDVVMVVADGDVFKAAKFVPDGSNAQIVGFARAAITSGSTGHVGFGGVVSGLSGLTPGTKYYPNFTSAGAWGTTAPAFFPFTGVAVSASVLFVSKNISNQLVDSRFPLDAFISERYEAALDRALSAAGISLVGKADASILESGDGCWRDWGDAYYWKVTGPKGAYGPAFTNHPYWSARLADDGSGYFSTHEFAFQINCKCPQNLMVGDTINLTIGGSGWGATYTRGDTLTLPIIAAQPLQLAGGQDGNAILDWYVTGSVDGALPNFTYDPGSPAPYGAGGLAFTYNPGGIPNQKGDTFKFTLEGGHYQWRKNGGSWSSSTAVPSGTVAFDAGLSIAFIPGLFPSFVANDMYRFTALQPWAVSNLQTPDKERWQWTGASPTLIADLGSAQTITMAAIARHTLPQGATLLLEGGTVPGVYTWSQTLTWNADAIVAEFDPQTARYLRLTLGSAAGGGIGWFWAGQPLTTTLSADVLLRRSYKVEASSGGLDQGGKYLARARSGQVSFQEAALFDADVSGLAAMLDWIKAQDDEPFCLVPNITRPEEAYMLHVAVDEVDFNELSDYNAAAGVRERRYTITMPLSGVWT